MIWNMISTFFFLSFSEFLVAQSRPRRQQLSKANKQKVIAVHITYKQVWIVGFIELRDFNVSFAAAFICTAAVAFNYAQRSIDVMN